MFKQNPTVQESVLSFRTLGSPSIDEVVKFILLQHSTYETADEGTRSRLISIANLVLIPILKSNWSFGVYEDQNLIAVYLQVDLLEYINISNTIDFNIVNQLLDITQFQSCMLNMPQNTKRGQYIFTLFNINKSIKRKNLCKKQGLYVCKLGGWKNMIFQTSNPFPFLKIGAEVLKQQQKQMQTVKKYLMKMSMSELNLNTSPFQKIYAKL